MRIGIGCDHGGYEMKEELKRRLTAAGHTVADKGIYSVHEVDYPDVAVEVAKGVVADEYDCAILVCGTGIGMSIAANKVDGIRAALVTDTSVSYTHLSIWIKNPSRISTMQLSATLC